MLRELGKNYDIHPEKKPKDENEVILRFLKGKHNKPVTTWLSSE